MPYIIPYIQRQFSYPTFSGRPERYRGAMTPPDLLIRNATYRRFVELGRAPTPDEIAAATGEGIETVRGSWRRLQAAHALVLEDDWRIRMANPFSAVETPHRVEAAGRNWYANCGWDAFGVVVGFPTVSSNPTT